MSKKSQKRAKRGGRGRKSIDSGENPVLEERCAFLAGELAKLKTRAEIIQACREKDWALSDRQIDDYLAVVRRRWREEASGASLIEKKYEAINQLKRLYGLAEIREISNGDGGTFISPDLWMMRQVIIDIAKFEGLDGNTEGPNGELDDILDELAEERAQRRSAASGN